MKIPLFLALAGLGCAGATSLLVLPYTTSSLAPRESFPATLANAGGKPVAFPKSGRSLIWVESVETGASPASTVPGLALENLKTTLPYGRNIIVYVPRDTAPLPARGRRPALETRFKGAQVLYDERDVIRAPGDSLSTRLGGLYLVEGTNIICRFLGIDNAAWESQNVRAPILAKAAAFIKTGAVTHCPEPVRVPGVRVKTTGLPGEGKVRLLLRITGDEADAPPNSATFKAQQTQDGGTEEQQQLAHPASERRYRLDTLTPLVKGAGATPIALVMNPRADFAKLRKTFPDWTFIAATPENALRWLELNGVILAADGTVRLSFLVFGGSTESGVDAVRAALQQR